MEVADLRLEKRSKKDACDPTADEMLVQGNSGEVSLSGSSHRKSEVIKLIMDVWEQTEKKKEKEKKKRKRKKRV